MRKVILYIATSLDGKIARIDGNIDWLPNPTEEDYGFDDFYKGVDTVLMGYNTYEVCLQLGDWFYKGKKAYVFSKSENKKVIDDAVLINIDPALFVQNLKVKEGGNIWLIGGGQIITLLHNAGLIDEYIIAFIPIILGNGLPLFPEVKMEASMQLTQHKVFKNGVVLLSYLTKKGK